MLVKILVIGYAEYVVIGVPLGPEGVYVRWYSSTGSVWKSVTLSLVLAQNFAKFFLKFFYVWESRLQERQFHDYFPLKSHTKKI